MSVVRADPGVCPYTRRDTTVDTRLCFLHRVWEEREFLESLSFLSF